MSIEQYRRTLATEVRSSITRLEKAQQRDKETVKNIGSLGIAVDIAIKKKKELEDSILNRDDEIADLNKRLKEVEMGLCDQELQRELTKGKNKAKSTMDNIERKRKQKVVEDTEKKVRLYSSTNDRNPEKDYNYFLKQFYKIDDSLPDYIRQNLSDMPNNKGYIWRGCWFLGNKRPEKHGNRFAPVIIFEKLRGGALRIHEYHEHEYVLYEKQGKEKRELVIQKPRQVKVQGKLYT
jgi:hypothetical protein